MAGAGPSTVWSPTPDKTNHSTRGWTSKTLFTYQWIGPDGTALEVPSGDDILSTVISNGENYRGSNILPPYYFAEDNYETAGRGYKITLYYQYYLNGSKTGIGIGMYDPSAPALYSTDRNVTTTSGNGWQQVKGQFYCTSFYDSGNFTPVFQVNGELMFSNKENYGLNDVYIAPYYNNGFTIDGGVDIEYEFQVFNASDASNSIYVNYLTIEEVS
jgi:hypothetical protein